MKISGVKKIMKTIFTYDLYTRKFVDKSYRTIEHIVPNRLLMTPKQKTDPLNLCIVDERVNRFRSDFRFGGSIEDILENENDEWETFNYSVFRNPRHRIFFPLYGRKVIAKTCFEMMTKYPQLYPVYSQIFIERDITKWYDGNLDMIDINYLKQKHSILQSVK